MPKLLPTCGTEMGVVQGDTIPAAKCFVKVGEQHTGEADIVENLIKSHNGAKSVELIVSKETYLSHVKSAVDSIDLLYSYRVKCKLASFLDNAFLDRFVRKSGANNIVLSETLLDHQDVYAIINGQLVLSLTKETYERAGLLGQKSRSGGSRYIVKYDLRDGDFYTSKLYTRLIWASQNTLTGEIPFIFVLDEELSASDAILLPGSSIYTKIAPVVTHISGVVTPAFHLPADSDDKESVQEYVQVCYEWSSLLSLGSGQVLKGAEVDPYLSTYSVIDSEENATDIVTVSWKGGPINNSWIFSLWKSLSAATSTDWLVLNVTGIEDIPIAWNAKEHVYSINGENNYSVFKLADDKTVCLKVVNGKDL